MAKPLETAVNTYRNNMLHAAARATTASTLFFLRETGTMIARNMPYSTIPMASMINLGRICPAAAPSSVPSVQPRNAIRISPYI